MQARLLKTRRTKIVATLGPASSSPEMIAALITAGVNVFRLNFSHGSHEQHRATYDRVRAAARQAGLPVAVLADLCGPKIRTGDFPEGGIVLTPGTAVTVTTRPVSGAPGLIPSQYAALSSDVRPGDRILINDGLFELRVEGVAGQDIACTVVHGGQLTSRKGINLPGVNVSAPSLTDKDRADAAFALGLGVDYLALSFVRRPEDVGALRAMVDAHASGTGIIAKMEKPEAVDNAAAIIAASDGIMVARGDLGVELPPEEVPAAQRLLIALARAQSKPVIVATQMMESMIQASRPTRAEVSDVANAVMEGADAVMLSAETASGAHPRAAVEMMARIARRTEALLWEQGAFGGIGEHDDRPRPLPFGEALARAVAHLSRDLRVRAIAVFTASGQSAQAVSSARPAAPVLVLSPAEEACRRANLLWGAVPLCVQASGEAMHAAAREQARALGLAAAGDHILLVRGFHREPAQNAPSVTVLQV